jgi:hypothetical protein
MKLLVTTLALSLAALTSRAHAEPTQISR